jgi:hypothetical protein
MDGGSCGPLFSRPSDVLRNLYDFPDRDVNVEMKKRLRSPVQARPVFDALNDLGATPWIINKDALKELVRAFDLSFKPDKQPLLTGLAVPMHKSTIQVPTIHEHFDYKNVAEIPTQEWVKFSKLEYELKKKR